MRIKSGQAWSLDVMIALVLFIGAFALFFGFFVLTTGDKGGELQDEATDVIDDLTNQDSGVSILEKSNINTSDLDSLLALDYNELKKTLGVQNDFCIYLEDEDGNVVYLNATATGKGSGIINVSNVPCFR